MIVNNESLLILIFLPLLAAVLSLLIRRPNVREIITLLIAGTLCFYVVSLWMAFKAGHLSSLHYLLLDWAFGLQITFHAEPLGLIFAIILSVLWTISIIYSAGYLRAHQEAHQGRFFCFFALAISAALGIAFSANLFTLFVFYELLTLVTYPLVAHHGTVEAKQAGRTYLSYLLSSSLLFLLPAMLITWHLTGSLDFRPGGMMDHRVTSPMNMILLGLFIFGVGKAAIMPIHRWLPAAMVAPAPVSALLHAVAVVKAGIFVLIKIVVYLFGVDYLKEMMVQGFWHGEWVVYLAGFTVITASIIAWRQDDLKKRLAYSTVSQLSYMIMILFLLHPLAIMAASFHLVAHAVAKITLFFAAGSIYTVTHKKKVSELNGIGIVMPWTMAAFAVAALSLIGLPFTVGFISKWYLLGASFAVGNWFVILVLIASTVLNAAYFLPIIYQAFFMKYSGKIPHGQKYMEAPLSMVAATSLTGLMTIGLFFFSESFHELASYIIG